MKTGSNIRIIILFAFVLMVPALLLAQGGNMGMSTVNNTIIPAKGFVILSSGDTVPGEIRWSMKYVENNPYEIKFTAENGASKVLNAKDIRGLICQVTMNPDVDPDLYPGGVEYYVSLPSMKKGTKVFYCRLMPGRITVYQNRSAIVSAKTTSVSDSRIDGIRFSYTLGEGLYIGPNIVTSYKILNHTSRFSSYYISKDNGPLLKVEKANYEAVFKDLFGDCQALNDELTKNPNLAKFKSFMLLVDLYNRLCDQ